ncbi:FAD-binding domain-containing protein [Lactarius sanguifluus]|nr:FAD-binding domain-containing protein [Lactarius sanguifluus]
MPSVLFTISAFSLVSGSLVTGVPALSTRHTPSSQHDFQLGIQSVCDQIASAMSNVSQVFSPPATEYASDNEHALASSSETSACSVEPGSTQDLGLILQVVGKSRTPFGVKSGGHSGNRGFSSTRGVQISLARFNTFNVNTQAQTVELGTGLTWGDIYERLDPYGVTVIGGRHPGVGVGGLTLGGGYSFKSNEHGLAIDNAVAFELVLPNGTVTTVTAEDHDLWFALRVSGDDNFHWSPWLGRLSLQGGGNNFGIVTKFTVKSHPQGQVWGGIILFGSDQLGAIKNATAQFTSKVTDPNAALVSSFFYSYGEVIPAVTLFYNAPQPPSGIFDAFLRIPNQQQDIHTRSYVDIVNIQAAPSTSPVGRGHYCGFPTTNYSLNFLDAIADQVLRWGSQLTPVDGGVAIAALAEPFGRGVFTHGTPSAYPPDRTRVFFPSILSFSWSNSSLDGIMARAIRESADSLRAAALKDGQDVEHAAVYPNNGLFDTPLEDMYGKNVPRLRALRRVVDPGDVMGLAGGFRF